MTGPKILITGGLGFIGSHLAERLNNLHYQTFVIDKRGSGPGRIDISDPRVIDLVVKVKPQVIFHLAADNRVTAPSRDVLTSNVIGTFNLLEAARKAKVKQFIFTSSAAVYGDPEFLPINEIHPTRPISGYGLSKLVGELYCRNYQDYFPVSIFRFSNVYGPRQESGSEGGVVAIFIDRLLKGQQAVIYGDGRQTRDFIFVADAVEALTLVLDKPQSFTLNIGSGKPTPIGGLFARLAKLMRAEPALIKKPFRPTEIKHSLFDCSLAKKTLGWQPRTKLIQGLYETVNYFTGIQRG